MPVMLRRLGLSVIVFLLLGIQSRAVEPVVDAEASGMGWTNPWRNSDGSLAGGTTVVDLSPAETGGETAPGRPVERVPRAELNVAGSGERAMYDRGIDSMDTKWRRQARLTGVRMRMLNGPEFAYAMDGISSGTEWGSRNHAGAVVPLNTRWELAALNTLSVFQLKEAGNRAGYEALSLRVGANPSVSFRPWLAVTPYVGLWEGNGAGVGLSGGLSKMWKSGMALTGEAYAWRLWDEGYATALQDGRSHGINLRGAMPVDRRLTLTGGVGYEFLELGPGAPDGVRYAGRRGRWDLRVDWRLLKRDGAYMGYGFRDQTLWYEQLVPVELGFFGDLLGERYIRPEGFDILSPEQKQFRQRLGIFYYQAISPHLGFNSEAYVGQDTRRGIRFSELRGLNMRLNMVFSSHFRMWIGWGYESAGSGLDRGGGPDRTFTFGFNYNF
ncbi:MAG: hypothetical protein FWG74_06905 [Planctomycetes bacterium]|nr:hypothetical protein [Planctomycetota bacterium]